MTGEIHKGRKTVRAKSRSQWRKWLERNHEKSEPVWLIIYRKNTGVATVTYSDAVEEALCFGWIDSTVNKRDEQSFYQYFSRRKPRSVWSKINKAKVKRMIKEGLMTPAGLNAIAIAKKNGSWKTLEPVDRLKMSEDMIKALSKNAKAKKSWDEQTASVKKRILFWLHSAKRPETKINRLQKVIESAKKGTAQLKQISL